MPLPIPHHIGRYQVIEKIGEGGMASVYKAFDPRLERVVALKLIRSDEFGSAALERMLKRFDREAKVLGRLTHSGIVNIIDYGEEDKVPYLTMPYIAGGTLKQKLGKPFACREAALLLLPISNALVYAHAQGIIHRDLKPANILLNDNGEPLVSDFGIAKILETTEGNTLTGTGEGIGTPDYMAPEQSMGKEIDHRVDIYSLGIVFYEMLTGRRPYTGDTPVAILLRHVYDPLPDPRQFTPNLPAAVYHVLTKALAKDPADRYANMAEFSAVLAAIAAGTLKESDASENLRQDGIIKTPPAAPAISVPKMVSQEPVTFDHLAATAATRQKPRRLSWKWIAALGILSVLLIAGIFVQSSRNISSAMVAATAASLMQVTSGEQPARTALPTPLEALAQKTQVASQSAMPPSPSPAASQPKPVLPVQWGAAYPYPQQAISASNLKSMTQLVQSGWGSPQDLVYSKDGKYLALASSNGIHILDTQSKERLYFFQTEHWVNSISISPDSLTIAGGLADNSIRLWDLQTGSLLRQMDGGPKEPTCIGIGWNSLTSTLQYHPGCLGSNPPLGMTSVAFSPDGSRLASGSVNGNVQVWNPADGSLVNTFKEHTGIVWIVAFSPDGSQLASGADDSSIRIWQISDGQTLLKIETPQMVFALAYSPDGSQLAVGLYLGDIQIRSPETGQIVSELKGHPYLVNRISYSADGKQLASASVDNLIAIWDAQSAKQIKTLKGHEKRIMGLSLARDGNQAASISTDGGFKVWDIEKGTAQALDNPDKSPGGTVKFSQDGSLILDFNASTARLWKTSDLSLDKSIPFGFTSNDVSISPDNLRLAVSDYGGNTIKCNVSILNISDNSQAVYIQDDCRWGLVDIRFSQDGNILAAASNDNRLRLWWAADGSLLRGFTAQSGTLFSSDGNYIAGYSVNDNLVTRVWRLVDGKMVLNTLNTSGALAFSPDSRWIAVGTNDNAVSLRSIADDKELFKLQGGSGEKISSLAFSQDGSLLISSSADGDLSFWDTSDGSLIQTLQIFSGAAQVSFSQDGRLMLTQNGMDIRLWGIAP